MLSDLFPSWYLLIAERAECMTELVILVVGVGNDLSTLRALDFQLFKNIFDHAADRLEITRWCLTVLVNALNAPVLHIFAGEAWLTVTALTTGALKGLPHEVLANSTRGQPSILRVVLYNARIDNIVSLDRKFSGGHDILTSVTRQ